jgi:hypothetical protein
MSLRAFTEVRWSYRHKKPEQAAKRPIFTAVQRP